MRRRHSERFSRLKLLSIGLSGLLLCCERPPRETPTTAPNALPPEPVAQIVEAPDLKPAHEAIIEKDLPGPENAQPEVVAGARAPHFADETSHELKASFETLKSWVRKNSGNIYAAAADLETDQFLLRENAQEAVNVASNAKILTAAAALSLLGPAYQFKTELFGHIAADGVCTRLVLRGGGAPDLSSADLYRFISVLKGRGLERVEHLFVDQSLFDANYIPPAYEQQPGEWASFRANVSALAIDENAVTLNVMPTKVGEHARIWYDPPGVVNPIGHVLTSKAGAGDKVAWSLDPKSDPQHMASKVGGSLAADLERHRYVRRLEDPRLAGGLVLAELLRQGGIEVGEVALGEVAQEKRIALWQSEPLAEIVRALGKDSDNFYAEMLFVALSQVELSAPSQTKSGAPQKTNDPANSLPWSSSRGAQTLTRWLTSLGMWSEGTVVKNGSGLFDANRYSPELLVSVLGHIENNPRIYHDFVSHLAMGATDGTMRKRMQTSELAGRIRAKTGTLRDVSALTGYIHRSKGRAPIAFSVVIQGAKTSHAEIRKRVDEMVLAWAQMKD